MRGSPQHRPPLGWGESAAAQPGLPGQNGGSSAWDFRSIHAQVSGLGALFCLLPASFLPAPNAQRCSSPFLCHQPRACLRLLAGASSLSLPGAERCPERPLQAGSWDPLLVAAAGASRGEGMPWGQERDSVSLPERRGRGETGKEEKDRSRRKISGWGRGLPERSSK